MNAKRLPARTLRDILDNDAAHNYEGFSHISWRNAKVEYQVLAGSHLGPRKQMAEFMPYIQQLVNTPPMMQAASDADLIFDFNNFIETWSKLAGYPYKQPFFKPMTAEQKQKRDANSQAALQQQKLQAAQGLQAQKDNAKSQQIADQSLGRAAEKTLQLMTEHTMQHGSDEGSIENQGAGE